MSERISDERLAEMRADALESIGYDGPSGYGACMDPYHNLYDVIGELKAERGRISTLEKERDALAAALDRVEAALMMRQRKSHHDTCTAELIPGSECDCGFVAAQIALSASIPYALKSHDATIRRQARQAALVEAARWVKDHRYMIPSSEYGSGWNDALDAAEIRLRKMAEAESSD